MALTLVALRYFRAVADAGSVTAAAIVLDVAQSAISRQIQSLEDELGTPLLLRHRQGVSLTPAGERLLERAKGILKQCSELRTEIGAMEPKPRGEVRIGFPPSLSQILIAPAVAAFAAAFGDVALWLLEGFSREVAQRICDDEMDFGIVSALLQNPRLSQTPLFAEEIWLVGKPENWRFGNTIGRGDIRGEPLIVTDVVHRLVVRWAGDRGFVDGRTIRTNAQAMLLPLLQLGVGHLVVPRSSVHAQLETGELVGAPMAGLHLTRYLVEPKDRVRSAAGQKFVEELERGIEAPGNTSTLLKIR